MKRAHETVRDMPPASHRPEPAGPVAALFSRRAFLARAGQVGYALSISSPGLSRFLLAQRGVASEGDSVPGGSGQAGLNDVLVGLRWRMIGPFRAGRVASVTGVPGRPNEFYFGAVNGGVWKSIDAGRVWQPIFDSQPVASIGAITVAPSAPDVIYVGSGESTLRDSAGYGNGMYRSLDAGKTWRHVGLEATQHIGKIAVHPHDPNVVFVAAIGQLYASNAERGVFRTTDGGASWKKLLGDENVGAVEVVIDPSDPRVIYAGMWNTHRPPWFTYAPTNGPGGGIFKSTDGGDTWTRLGNGLPQGGIGRTGIAVSASNPRRVYAVVDSLVPDAPAGAEPPLGTGTPRVGAAGATPVPPGAGGVFRSDDAGASWTRMSSDPALWGRGWYFEKVTVDPLDPDTVYVPNVAVNRSMDGGRTWVALRGSPGGDDYHQSWISPTDPNTMIQASDQGAIITHNARAADPRDVTWSSWLNQPTAQLYHLSVDYRFPYWVTGAQQDSGAIAVRSRGKFAEISMHDWEPIAPGGESGYTAGDPLHPGIVYGGAGTRYDLATNIEIPTTVPKSPEPARTDWTQPLVFSKANPRALYYANQFLFETTNGAQNWRQISPDLTRANPGIPPNVDAAAAAAVDRNGKRGVIYTIAPSPLNAPMVWIGTDDGYIQLTRDNGASWQNVTPAAITAWSRVTMLEASHFDAASAYASVDRHQLEDFDPYIYRTRDQGGTWQRITTGLPAGVYVHVVREDPTRRGMLFAGTERGVYVSLNDGDAWQPLQLNLPVTSMRDFQIYERDLILATHGRGFWILDDISSLRQIDAAILASPAYLFRPADTVNVLQGGDNGTPLQKDEPQAENPPSGVVIDYYLKSPAHGAVTLEVLDASGRILHAFSSEYSDASSPRPAASATSGIPKVSPLWTVQAEPLPTSAGVHRVVWSAQTPRQRGVPASDEPPTPVRYTGSFTVRLTVDGKPYTQPLVVSADPRGAQLDGSS